MLVKRHSLLRADYVDGATEKKMLRLYRHNITGEVPCVLFHEPSGRCARRNSRSQRSRFFGVDAAVVPVGVDGARGMPH